MKFDIEKYAGNYVMHCKTEEEAKDFCKYLDSIGRTWLSGAKYVDNSHWSDYGPNTTYWFNSGLYDCIEYATVTYATILEWSDFMDADNKEKSKGSNNQHIDHTEEVFKLLGISPNEVFKVKSLNGVDYKINEGLGILFLNGQGKWEGSQLSLVDFLNGNVTIYKKPIPTEMEQLAIDYALACGYHWLAKDKDGSVRSYEVKPFKDDWNDAWSYVRKEDRICNCSKVSMGIELPISFLSWEDNEPYYIGD